MDPEYVTGQINGRVLELLFRRLKKENLWRKFFFQIMLNEVLETCEK